MVNQFISQNPIDDLTFPSSAAILASPLKSASAFGNIRITSASVVSPTINTPISLNQPEILTPSNKSAAQKQFEEDRFKLRRAMSVQHSQLAEQSMMLMSQFNVSPFLSPKSKAKLTVNTDTDSEKNNVLPWNRTKAELINFDIDIDNQDSNQDTFSFGLTSRIQSARSQFWESVENISNHLSTLIK